ncbi:MAG: T9SS type A sorting domain-containing protein [Ignavibacteria bacterium]|nr:T9SS type A sorting domain-containing protein [Ignavibacteria bacterium]
MKSLILFVVFNSVLFGQFSQEWDTLSFNHYINDMKCTNNGNLFISTEEGLFKSTDLGNTFESLSNTSTILTTVVNENQIFSYLNNSIVVYTSDNGSNWILKTNPLTNEYPSFFEADERGWLYLGTEDGNLFRSKDNATNWTKIYDHPSNNQLSKISFKDSNIIYLAIHQQGLDISTDTGETWNEFISTGSGGWGGRIDFVQAPNGDFFVSDLVGFFQTDSNGIFKKKRLGFYQFNQLEIDKNNNLFMAGYQNVFKSTDMGNTWYPLINKNYSSASTWMYILTVDSVLFARQNNSIMRNIIKPGVIPNTIGKNYFPTKVGNSYMYRDVDWTGMYPSYVTYSKYYITADSIINGKEYFHHTNFGWVRYSEEEKRLVKFNNGSEDLIMDFNYPEGTLISRPITFEPFDSQYIQIIGNSTVPNYQFHSKGFTFFVSEGSYSFLFTENIGYSGSNGINYTFGSVDNKLIQCISTDTLGNPFIIDYTHNPQILFQPVTTTKDSIISFQFTVKHNYSAACSVLLGTNNFIETVTMEGFYTNGVDTTDFTPINGMNLHCTLEYVITTPINLDKLKSGYKLYYRLTAKDKGMMPHYGYSPNVSTYHTIKFDTTNSINITDEIPNEFALYQNYPNPFNPTTKIKFAIPKSENVTLKVYDILGKELFTLVNEWLSAGTYDVTVTSNHFNHQLSSGVYIYRIQAGEYSSSKKLILMK